MNKDFSITRFIGSLENYKDANIVLAGFPYDCTSSFSSDSRFASREIRSYSNEAIETFSFHQKKDLENVKFFDIGDMEVMVGNPDSMVQKVKDASFKIINDGKKLLGIGGEHLITFPLYLATNNVHGDFTMLQLDAHADLRQSYLDNSLSHASVMNLCLDNGLKRLVQMGVRSATQDEYKMIQNDERIISVSNIKDLEDVIKYGEKIYITLDVDFFDPSFLSATGTPEAGGKSFDDFIEVLKILNKKKVNIVGADIVEFSPNLDHSNVSKAFAAKLVREMLLFM